MPVKGETDLATLDPLLALEWDYTKNKDLTPENVKCHSGKRVWWKCIHGHSWKTSISNRSQGTQCPYCTGRLPIEGETDLKTLNPLLASEWDYKENGDLRPEHVTCYSDKKAWWRCKHGHSWEAIIGNRSTGTQCPYCAGKLPIKGETDLKTINPLLASEWDYIKNGHLKPEYVTCRSDKKVWWKCKHGHSWNARIANRTVGTNCPYCNNK